MVIFKDQHLLSYLEKSYIPSSFAYHFLTAAVLLLLFEEASWIYCGKCIFLSEVSFPYAESVEVILFPVGCADVSCYCILCISALL